MASGHVNRIKEPNTWLHRPMLQNREESSCQPGAVHTWHDTSDVCSSVANGGKPDIIGRARIGPELTQSQRGSLNDRTPRRACGCCRQLPMTPFKYWVL